MNIKSILKMLPLADILENAEPQIISFIENELLQHECFKTPENEHLVRREISINTVRPSSESEAGIYVNFVAYEPATGEKITIIKLHIKPVLEQIFKKILENK